MTENYKLIKCFTIQLICESSLSWLNKAVGAGSFRITCEYLGQVLGKIQVGQRAEMKSYNAYWITGLRGLDGASALLFETVGKAYRNNFLGDS